MGCEDNIPRDRPTFNNSSITSSSATTEEEEETEEETDETVVEMTRPDGAIVIQPGSCACNKAGEAISVGNCKEYCSSVSNPPDPDTFYFDVQVTTAISETYLQDVAGFCSTQTGIDPEDETASCYIEVKDQNGNTLDPIGFQPAAGKTKFSIPVSNLGKDTTYRLSIVETNTGARSTSTQLRMDEDIIVDNIGGPLALMPVNQYACMFRSGEFDQNTGELFVTAVNRFHFYFTSESRPEPLLPSSLPSVNCYDMQTYGNTPINSPLLEETTNSFTVWNKNDPRFYQLDGSEELRVHELIKQELEFQGQTVEDNIVLFETFQWPSGINDGDESIGSDSEASTPTTITSEVGFYMTPFLDTSNYKAYCPTRYHYESSNPLFKAMKEIVAVDTEGLYAAKQDNVCDFILIKESLLKQIWFYIEGGQHIQPTEQTVAGKKVQFYWPADTNSPYIKKSHQRVYTLKAATEISCGDNSNTSSGSNDGSGNRTNFPTHDKRIACIPKLVN